MLDNTDFLVLESEKQLKIYGYTVDATKNLSDNERFGILKNLVDTQELRVEEIENCLRFLINMHDGELGFEQSVRKWKTDLEYVSTLFDDGSTQITLFSLGEEWI